MRPVHYRSCPPPPSLRDTVAALWTLDAPHPVAAPFMARVLPDGCMDIIVNSGDPHVDGEGRVQNACPSYAVGTMTRPLLAGHRGAVCLTAARFRPGAAQAFLPAPAHELTDGVAPLDALWGTAAAELEERIAAAPTPAARVAVLAGVLARRLPAHWRPDPVVAGALAHLDAAAGHVPIRVVAAAAGVDPRRLQRAFADLVGVPPKVAARVARLQRATTLARAEPHLPWARLAIRCGYADQPHLVREFRALAGVTPTAWRREVEA